MCAMPNNPRTTDPVCAMTNVAILSLVCTRMLEAHSQYMCYLGST